MRFGRVIVFRIPQAEAESSPVSYVYHSMSKPGFVVLSHCSAVLRISEWYHTVITPGYVLTHPPVLEIFKEPIFGM
jgi:hypothetical protein